MKRRTAIILFVICTLFIVLIAIFAYSYYNFVKSQENYLINETFSIANWNLQIFGDKKANDSSIMDYYAENMRYYDIIFLQEIRDKDGSSFFELCSKLPEYECLLSSRAGRSSSKEQYGILFLKKFDVQLLDYNPDPFDRWERPPIRAIISLNNYSIIAYNIHTKPDAATEEIYALEELILSEYLPDWNYRNILALGDLNADCNYYDENYETAFSKNNGWHWIIKNSDDTTAGYSVCAYDRIIINSELTEEYVSYGVEKTEYSDHYLVWARFRDREYEKDVSFGAFLKSIKI
ncbi:MAG: endonuclease/exonuclease/phosphatase family protein [Candidatus Woesearchaeota archaeon]